MQWCGAGASKLPFPFNLVGKGIKEIFAGWKARDLTNANMKTVAACVLVLAATLSEFGAQVVDGGLELTESQRSLIQGIAEEDLVELQKLVDKWARKWSARRLGFGAKGFVDAFEALRKRLNLKLGSLTSSTTLTIQKTLLDFKLTAVEHLETIANKIGELAALQEQALAHVAAVGSGATVGAFQDGLQSMQEVVARVERTLLAGQGDVLALVTTSLGDLEAKLTQVVGSGADKIDRRVQRFCSNVSEKLEDLEDKMEELGVALQAGMSELNATVGEIRDTLHRLQVGKDNRARREELVMDHEISIRKITHQRPPKLLGSGGFGNVFLVEHDMTLKALKVVDLAGMSRKKMKKAQKAFENELAVNCKLRHTFIATVYGGVFDDPPKVGMVMEYAPNGDLNQYLEEQEVSPRLKFRILLQIAIGMEYLMEQNVFHKDLKVGGVLYMYFFRPPCLLDFYFLSTSR